MGTRSAIGYKTGEGKIRAVYCHWDGYVSNNGRILQESYQAAYKIARLIEQGDMSSLAAEPMPKTANHSFNTPDEGVVVYYGRDRGETGCETKEFANFDEFETEMSHMGCEYFYVFNGREWIVSTGTGVFDRVEDLLELEAVA